MVEPVCQHLPEISVLKNPFGLSLGGTILFFSVNSNISTWKITVRERIRPDSIS